MYLNVIQLAESFGVEENVVEGWIRKESLPVIEDRGRFLFDRAQVVEWAAARGMAAKAGFLAARQGSNARLRLESMLRAGGIFRGVPAAEVHGALEKVIAGLSGATPPVRQLLAQRIHAVGGISWAAVGGGLALPHLRLPVALGRDTGVLGIVFLRDALPLTEPAPDNTPVTRLLFFVAPSPRAHLEILAQLSGALSRGHLRQCLLDGAPDGQIFKIIAEIETGGSAKGTHP